MALWRNKQGFTFIHTLAALSILFITLPFIGYLLKAAEYETNYEFLSTQQFFRYMQDEMLEATNVAVTVDTANLSMPNGDLVAYEKYGSQIRRRVNKQGHEVYLRDIRTVKFSQKKQGVLVKIETAGGHVYEKTIFLYG